MRHVVYLTLYLLEAHYMRHVVYFNPLPARGALYASCGVF